MKTPFGKQVGVVGVRQLARAGAGDARRGRTTRRSGGCGGRSGSIVWLNSSLIEMPRVAGREEGVVGIVERLPGPDVARAREPPDDALARRHDQDPVVVAVGDQHVSGNRPGLDGRQAEDGLRGSPGGRRLPRRPGRGNACAVSDMPRRPRPARPDQAVGSDRDRPGDEHDRRDQSARATPFVPSARSLRRSKAGRAHREVRTIRRARVGRARSRPRAASGPSAPPRPRRPFPSPCRHAASRSRPIFGSSSATSTRTARLSPASMSPG